MPHQQTMALRLRGKPLLWRCGLALFVAVAILAAAGRFAILKSHFAHFDDIGVAATILGAETNPPPLPAVLRPAMFPFIAVPLYWTYAPLPFLATPFLVTPEQSYDSVKFWGRLPSLFFTMAALLAMAAIAFRLQPKAPWALAAMMAAPLAFSREFTIVAAQMHPYAAAAAAAAALLWLTLHDAPKIAQPLGWRFGLSRGIALVGLLCLSYQTVIMAPGYFAALAAGIARQEPPRRWVAKAWPLAIAGVIFTVAFIPAYFFRIRQIRAIWWNAGPHNEFVFIPPRGLLSTIAEAGRFLAVDSWLTLQGLIAPAAEDSATAVAVTAVFAAAIVAGLGFALARAIRASDWPAEAALGIYAGVTLGLLFALVLAGKLTLSPTRHLVAYLPLLAVLAGWGFHAAIASWRRDETYQTAASAMLAVAVGLVFYSGFGTFQRERADAFDESALIAIAKETRADLAVAYDFTQQLRVMPGLQRTLAVTDTGSALPATAPKSPQRLLFVSQRSAFDSEECRAFVEKLAAVAAESGKCSEPDHIQRVVEKPSEVESDFSARTKNGTNGLFVTLVDLSR